MNLDLKSRTNSSDSPKRALLAPSQAIDRTSPIPLYYQLYQFMVGMLESGKWEPGALIPGEMELSQEFELSRTTVRQALLQLVNEGYLSRRRGLGTVVAKPKLRHGPQRDLGITGYLRARGLRPGWQLLGMEPVIPSKRVAAAIGVPEKQKVLRVRRLRLADDEVIGIHTVYVPYPLADSIRDEYMTAGESSLHYLQEFLKVSLSETHRYIEAIPADETAAELLKVDEDTPLLVIRRITINAEGQPVEYLHAAYRGDRFEYYVHLEH